MDWATDKRAETKSGSKLDIGSKEERENCLEPGEKSNGVCAIALAIAEEMLIVVDEEVEEGVDDIRISHEEELREEEPDSVSIGGESRSSLSELHSSELLLENMYSSFPGPWRFTLALLFWNQI